MKVTTIDPHFLSSKSTSMSWPLHQTFVIEIKKKDTEQIESKNVVVAKARYYKLISTTFLFFIS